MPNWLLPPSVRTPVPTLMSWPPVAFGPSLIAPSNSVLALLDPAVTVGPATMTVAVMSPASDPARCAGFGVGGFGPFTSNDRTALFCRVTAVAAERVLTAPSSSVVPAPDTVVGPVYDAGWL